MKVVWVCRQAGMTRQNYYARRTDRSRAAVDVELMLELVRAFPPVAPVVGDLLARNLDWPGAEEIAERMAALLPAAVKGPDPALAEMAAKVQALGQALAAEQAKFAALKADQDHEARKLEISAFQAETDRLGGEAVKLTLAELLKNGSSTPLPLPAGLFPKVSFSEAATKLRVGNNSKLPAYALLTESGFDRTPPTKPVVQGFEILREYTDAEGKPITQVKLGDELEVHVKFRAVGKRYLNDVALVDLLPGGFEIVQPPPASAEQVLAQVAPEQEPAEEEVSEEGEEPVAEMPKGAQCGCGWLTSISGSPLTYADYREDRAVLYIDIDDQVGEVKYRLKAVAAGVVIAVPAAVRQVAALLVAHHLPGQLGAAERQPGVRQIQRQARRLVDGEHHRLRRRRGKRQGQQHAITVQRHEIHGLQCAHLLGVRRQSDDDQQQRQPAGGTAQPSRAASRNDGVGPPASGGSSRHRCAPGQHCSGVADASHVRRAHHSAAASDAALSMKPPNPSGMISVRLTSASDTLLILP